MFPYINRLHDILKDQESFPLIRMPLHVRRVHLSGTDLRKDQKFSVNTPMSMSRKPRDSLYLQFHTFREDSGRVPATSSNPCIAQTPLFVWTF